MNVKELRKRLLQLELAYGNIDHFEIRAECGSVENGALPVIANLAIDRVEISHLYKQPHMCFRSDLRGGVKSETPE